MGIGSIWHWLVLGLVIAVLFAPKRIPDLMGDVAKGIRAFRHGLKEAPEDPAGSVPDTPPAVPDRS
jgi:sec-independent protein translocase protein TatA